MLDTILIFFIMIFVMIISHEIGHILVAKKYTKQKLKLHFEGLDPTLELYGLDDMANIKIILGGVMVGFVPIVITFFFIPLISLMLFLFYIIGIMHDLTELGNILKW